MTFPARNTDPETSHEAAASLDLPELEEIVLAELRAAGPSGCTLDDLVGRLRMDKVTVSPRLRPLCNKSLVVPIGKRVGKAGRNQTVWCAA